MVLPLSVLAVLLAACGGAAVSPPARVVAVDSVRLLEDPDHPIGESIGIVVRDADGRVFLADFGGRTIQRYEADGRFGGTIPASDWLSVARTAMISVLGALHPFLKWDRLTDSVAPFGEAPVEWGGSPGLAMSHGVASLVTDADGYPAMIPLVPGLLRLDAAGSRGALVPVPAVRRKGEPDGAAVKAVAEAKRSGKRTTAPLETDVFARPIFAGDTVYFVSRTVGVDDRAPLWLRGFVLDDSTCTWLPVVPGT